MKKTYTIAEDQGAVALFTRVSLSGYKTTEVHRKGNKVTVTYERNRVSENTGEFSKIPTTTLKFSKIPPTTLKFSKIPPQVKPSSHSVKPGPLSFCKSQNVNFRDVN